MTLKTTPVRALLLALALALTSVPVAAHAADPFEPRPTDDPAMVTAWEAWEATGIDDYTLTVERSCFCPDLIVIRTVVRNGEVRKVTRGDRRLEDRRGFTMDRLFTKIRKDTETSDRVEVTYTPRGVPKSIIVDPIELATDEESYYTVTLTRL